MKRLYILVTPIFSIMLHRIYRPDEQRDLHDHPWNFLSILLWGWYTEQVEGGEMKKRRWFSFKKATDRHAIAVCTRKPVWSLVFTGRRQRVWGFWVDGGTRFVPFDKYERLNEKWTGANGEKNEKVNYFDIILWKKSAEIFSQYMKKGRPVLVGGRLQQDRWETEGVKKSRIRVVVSTFQFLGAKPEGSGAPPEGHDGPPDEASPGPDNVPF